MSRLAPLPMDAHPELKDAFATYVRTLGFVPNSVLIMQRIRGTIAPLPPGIPDVIEQDPGQPGPERRLPPEAGPPLAGTDPGVMHQFLRAPIPVVGQAKRDPVEGRCVPAIQGAETPFVAGSHQFIQ